MKRIVLTATALLALTGTAAASSLYVVDSTPSFVSQGYNLTPASLTESQPSGSFGKVSPSPVAISATYLGSLDFSFNSYQPVTQNVGTVEAASSTSRSFAVLGDSLTRQLATIKGQTYSFDYILGFNDSMNGDADFDDFVVGVNFKPSVVPLPAAAWLFGSALFGFVMVSNRRKV